MNIFSHCYFVESGTSTHVCDDNYAGSKPFSETEVKQIADYLVDLNKPNQFGKHPIVAFLDIHSYGQMWMSPFGYSERKPEDFKRHVRDNSMSSFFVLFYVIFVCLLFFKSTC